MMCASSGFHLFLEIILFTIIVGCNADPGPIVTVSTGDLEGKIIVTKENWTYNSFQGIPYAKPPIGDLRFKNPQPIGNWSGIRDATVVGSACPQFDGLLMHKYYGNEDCLFLNVYVPNRNHSQPLPVMLWIHGGGFISGDGSPNIYGPEYFLRKKMIVVTINYRLGALGFLNLNMAEVPGNAGLKDQSLAIKWVKQNIKYFGGCGHSITIFGLGAGAASAQYQMLSPMSRGLFRGVIIQSGSSSVPWALQTDPVSVGKELASVLGIGKNTYDVGEFLRSVSALDIVVASVSQSFTGKVRLSFAPSVETVFPGVEAFITSSPKDILKSGKFHKVPMLIGLNQNNGLIFRTKAFGSAADEEAIKNNCIPDLKQFVPDELKDQVGSCGFNPIISQIENHYFSCGDYSKGLTNLYTDFAFVKDTIPAIKHMAKHCPAVYFYRYSYTGTKDLLRQITDLEYCGTGHMDELAYMFNVQLSGIEEILPSKSDEIETARILEMAINFIRHGNPTPRKSKLLPVIWKKTSPKNTICYDMNKNFTLIPNPFAKQLRFWNNLGKGVNISDSEGGYILSQVLGSLKLGNL